MTSLLRIFLAKLQALFQQSKANREFNQELQTHLQLLTERFLRQGMSPEEAGEAAQRQFGNSLLLQQQHREARGFYWLAVSWRDLRFGARQLVRSPLFTVVAVASLALGIGVNVAIFSVAKVVLLDTLPVKDAHELRMLTWVSGPERPIPPVWGDVWSVDSGLAGNAFSYAVWEEMRKKTDVFRDLIAFKEIRMTVAVDGHSELLGGQLVSGGAFRALGVVPILGRSLEPADDAGPGKGPVVVISEGFWAARFARSSAVLGKVIAINGVPVTIVGVSPPQFTGLQMGSAAQVFVPLTMQPLLVPRAQLMKSGDTSLLNNPQSWWLHILVRLRPEVPEARAQAALSLSLRATAMATLPAAKGLGRFGLQLDRGDRGLDELHGEFANPSYVLLALAGLVLLLACVNLANLLLARGASRQAEMSTRLALGASRAQLLRQILTENLLLASLGGVAGLGLALLMRSALPSLLGNSSGRNSWSAMVVDARFDWKVLGFTAAISCATGLLFGIFPAWQAIHRNVNIGLKASGKATSGGRRLWLSKALVITQVALSIILLIGAGLFVRTLLNLKRTSLGFRTDHILLFQLDPPRTHYSEAQMVRLYRQLEERFAAIPGVRSVSLSNIAIIGDGHSGTTFHMPGRPVQVPEERVQINSVGTFFFATMGIPILQGRGFTAHDTPASPTVAVVNQALARRFSDQNPIGQMFQAESDDANGPIQIVGIAADTRYADLRSQTPPLFYVPYLQQPNSGRMVFEVRTAADPGSVLQQLRTSIESLDRELPMTNVRTMDEQVAASLSAERIFADLTSGFGLLALVLASIGIYGVMAYTVIQRRPEIGVRMALGAPRSSVLWMVMREVLAMLGIGLAAGIACSLALTRLVAAQLFGVRATDIWTYLAAIALLSAAALVSGFMPAQRASAIDPLATLRYE